MYGEKMVERIQFWHDGVLWGYVVDWYYKWPCNLEKKKSCKHSKI